MTDADRKALGLELRRSTRQRGIPADVVDRIRKARADGLSWSECRQRFGYSLSSMYVALVKKSVGGVDNRTPSTTAAHNDGDCATIHNHARRTA